MQTFTKQMDLPFPISSILIYIHKSNSRILFQRAKIGDFWLKKVFGISPVALAICMYMEYKKDYRRRV